MIALPLLMVPASSEPAAEVEKENNLYYFKISGHSVSWREDKQVEFIYKNLTPDPQDVYITVNVGSKTFTWERDNLILPFEYIDLWGYPGTFVTFEVKIYEAYNPVLLASFDGIIKLPPVN